jgi:hypothetical protein
MERRAMAWPSRPYTSTMVERVDTAAPEATAAREGLVEGVDPPRVQGCSLVPEL